MRRSDWLTNKKPERVPRPKRIFELTDTIISALNFHYGTRLENLGIETFLIDYLETLPAFFKSREIDKAQGIASLAGAMNSAPIPEELGIKMWVISNDGVGAVLVTKTSQALGYQQMSHVYTLRKENNKWRLVTQSDTPEPEGYLMPNGGWVDSSPPMYVESTQWPTNPFAETEWNSTGPGLGSTTITSTGETNFTLSPVSLRDYDHDTNTTSALPANGLTSGDTNGQIRLDTERPDSIVNWDEDDDIPF